MLRDVGFCSAQLITSGVKKSMVQLLISFAGKCKMEGNGWETDSNDRQC